MQVDFLHQSGFMVSLTFLGQVSIQRFIDMSKQHGSKNITEA